ncbi:carbon-nitrogen hydrolase family protein [Burkholderia sp. Ac-20345]|uniref:carbon-nitrogen hydrolase family protein n=1 Tax=Burkholderia sp. Ac-20345 TaxID=2703891 RepID=UPI00197CB43C|nr:carbon-nitrogen hydrolase family protein [Burkholderia sp. Ac-20345]MBN3782861.1 carbon-nitrogen hydrolase family protein [Burkholderia sp. Ac-20345]
MSLKHQKYIAAVVQAAPAFLDLAAGIEKSVKLIDEAGRAGAKLIAFPETWLPGYPFHIWLGTPAWAMQRGFVQRYFDESLAYDSVEAEALREAARRNEITVVMGLSERSGGSLYIAQWLIGPDGATIAKRRKLKATFLERIVFGEGDGSDLAVFPREDVGRIGALCCWEHIQPLTKYAMYAQHEQVHVASWPSFSCYEFAHALGPEANNAVSKVYAIEGQCFVLAPCATVSTEMVELLCDTPDKRELIRAGGGHAVAYGPDGAPLTDKLREDEEGLLLVQIDLGLISLSKAAADPVGHYARPDVTRLLLNRQPRRCVEHCGSQAEELDASADEEIFRGEHDV